MKRILALLLLVCLMVAPGCMNSGGTVIYGNDDRVDYWQIKEEVILANAKATASMWYRWQINDLGNNTSHLRTSTYGKSKNLHYDERFWSQPIGAFGTAFLVKPGIVVSAGHCVGRYDSDIRIVFGFKMKSKSSPVVSIKNHDIYRIKKVIIRKVGGVDYSVIMLDRDVTDIKPLTMASNDAKKGDSVYIIGHPTGLPIKYAPNAKVLSVGTDSFQASLDAYAGNSGSPVFNSDNKVVGILVRGATDFVRDGSRYRSNRKQTRWYNGEGVTKLSVWREYVPKFLPPPAP
jgi:S1-C subfamily serine protease